MCAHTYHTEYEVAQPLLFSFAFAFFFFHLYFPLRFFLLLLIFILILNFFLVFISILISFCIFVLPTFTFQSAFHVLSTVSRLRFRLSFHLHFAFNSYLFVTPHYTWRQNQNGEQNVISDKSVDKPTRLLQFADECFWSLQSLALTRISFRDILLRYELMVDGGLLKDFSQLLLVFY